MITVQLDVLPKLLLNLGDGYGLANPVYEPVHEGVATCE